MRVKPLVFGLSTFIPGAYALLSKPTGGTDSARYCYTVWLRHLITARANGLVRHPSVVVELGPGDSLGVGLAALICGADDYYAIDADSRARADTCLTMFDQLVDLFRQRAPLPDEHEFPRVRPRLRSYAFPHAVLTDAHLAESMREERLACIRAAVATLPAAPAPPIHYLPASQAHLVPRASADVVLSQGVLEYPEDLPATYASMFEWLRPGGVASHAIEFGAHQTSNAWDGHWAISDFAWACLRGRLPYYPNREPHSRHIAAARGAGFHVLADVIEVRAPQTRRDRFVPRFAHLSDADITAGAAFIQVLKPDVPAVTFERGAHMRLSSGSATRASVA